MPRSSHPMRILLVEDNPADANLLQILLQEDASVAFTVDCVPRLRDAFHSLNHGRYDLMLLDLSLPDSHGIDTVAEAHEHAPTVPIVVYTHQDDESLGRTAIRYGAQDYLLKGQLSSPVMQRSLRYAIERHRLTTEIQALSFTDELTGLYNRRGFQMLARQFMNTAQRMDHKVVLLFIDIDNMKQINDQWGHSMGDQALQETATILRHCFRQSDILARFGGDEFVIAAQLTPDIASDILGSRLEKECDCRNLEKLRPYSLRLSIGYRDHLPESAQSFEEILAEADTRMYEQKQQRKAHAQVTLVSV